MTGGRGHLIASPSQTVGPFFQVGLTTNPQLGLLVYPDTKGERIRLRVRVVDGAGDPVPDALAEVWQADANGGYVEATPERAATMLPIPRFTGFGRLPTGVDGSCEFDTIRPGRVPDGRGGRQASHINLCLFMRGLLRPIYTRIYFTGDPDLAEDPVMRLVPEARRPGLLARAVPGTPITWTFDVRLQGDDETVFFDL